MRFESTANQLTTACERLLGYRGYHVWRQNNIPVFDVTKCADALVRRGAFDNRRDARNFLSKHFRVHRGLKGVPDIIGFNRNDAKFVGVEIKVGADKLSHEQELFMETLKRAGGTAVVVSHIDDLLKAIDK